MVTQLRNWGHAVRLTGCRPPTCDGAFHTNTDGSAVELLPLQGSLSPSRDPGYQISLLAGSGAMSQNEMAGAVVSNRWRPGPGPREIGRCKPLELSRTSRAPGKLALPGGKGGGVGNADLLEGPRG